MGDQIKAKLAVKNLLLLALVIFCLGVECKSIETTSTKGKPLYKKKQMYDLRKGNKEEHILMHNMLDSVRHKSSRPIVRQTTATTDPEWDSSEVENYNLENPQTFDEYFFIVESFNLGFRVKNFFPAARDCTKTLRIFLNDANSTVQNSTVDALQSQTYDFGRNYTKIVSNQFAYSYLYCHMTGVDIYDYYLIQTVLYGSWVDWLQAALQNMVGNIIRINNLYQKMVIAQENEDQQQLWYIFGRISYYLLDIQPIEDAAYDVDDVNAFEKHATLTDVLRTFNKLMELQGRIQSGEIRLEDPHESYERDKQEFKQLLKEQRARERFENKPVPTQKQKDQLVDHFHKVAKVVNGPLSKIFAPAQQKPKRHPLVRQDATTDGDEITFDDEIPQDEPPAGPSFTEVLDLVIKYSEFGAIFAWEVQAATVGQISGNLSICQNNTLTVYNNSLGVYTKYQSLELDEAGNSTYRILYSVDNIYTACYYMFFEYFIALQVYVNTALDWKKLLFNTLHNLGSIYDLGEETYFRIVDFENQGDTVEFWARMGFISGSIFHNLFEYPVNYDEVSNPDDFEKEREE